MKHSWKWGMKRLPVKKEFPFDRIGSFRQGNPYTIAFVYPQTGEPYIIKGGYKDVKNAELEIKEPAVIHETYWFHGFPRLTVRLMNLPDKIQILKTKGKTKGRVRWPGDCPTGNRSFFRWEIVDWSSPTSIRIIKYLKRLPRKWIRELDQFTTKKEQAPKVRHRVIELEEE